MAESAQGRGRPTKLTKEVHGRIVLTISAGNFRETAAAECGIESRTLRNWIIRGAKGGKGNEACRALLLDIQEAEARFEIGAMLEIGAAGQRDWKAIQYRLAVLKPDRYGNKADIRLELNGAIRNVMGVARKQMTPDAYEQLLSVIVATEGSAQRTSGDTDEQDK